jgi:glucoamylase
MHVVDLPTAELASGSTIVFTLYWPAAERWENANYEVVVE